MLPPFQGGAAGCFGYDLARQIEKLPASTRDDPSMPAMMVGIYDQVLAFDHRRNRAWFITPGHIGRAGAPPTKLRQEPGKRNGRDRA